MAQLKPKHKSFIIKQLACYERPTEIIDLIQDRFGMSVSRSQVSYYNPENSQGSQQLAKKWKRLFQQTRQEFIEGTIDVPIAQKSFRIRELQKIYNKFWDMKNYQAAAGIIEQVAKEMGGAYESYAEKIAEQVGEGRVNFYQQINQKIVQLNQKS